LTKIALEPARVAAFEAAITSAGAEVADLSPEVRGMVWTDYWQPDLLAQTLDANPQLEWVQLPFAGVDAFADLIKRPFTFTSAKGAYSEPVAEHALALCLAMGRKIPERAAAKSWGEKFAVSLYESTVLIIGGGGITQELLKLLKPFGCEVTVVNRTGSSVADATRTVDIGQLDDWLPSADFVVIAAALTDQTKGLFDAARLAKLKSSAYLINIARGGHVVTADLVTALNQEIIAGAALDVTDPEPLPKGHPLWDAKNCLITPHTADTPAQVTRLLAARIQLNAKAFVEGGDWVGRVDPVLGY